MAGLKKKKDSGLKKTGQFLGNYGKAAADIFLGTAGFKDVIKDEAYKGTGSDFWRKAANVNTIGNQVIGSAALAYTGAGGLSGAAFGNKMPQQQLQQPVQEIQPTYIEPQPIVTESDTLEMPKDNYEYLYQQQQDMYKFKQGGLNQYRTINIEKGELLVDPNTLEIIQEFNDAPKHPDGKHEIDLRGNREVPVGKAVIPAKLAAEYKNASPEKKKEIINSLPGFNGNPKAKDGVKKVTSSTMSVDPSRQSEWQGYYNEAIGLNPGNYNEKDWKWEAEKYANYMYKNPNATSMTAGGGPIMETMPRIDTQYQSPEFVNPNINSLNSYANAKTFNPSPYNFGNTVMNYQSQPQIPGETSKIAGGLGGGNVSNAAIMASVLVPQVGFGLYQTIASNKALKKLAKEPYQMYGTETQPEVQQALAEQQAMAQRAGLESRYGLSPEQRALFNQQVSRDINTRMQRAQDLAGNNLSAAVGNVMNANKISAYQGLAAQDAQLQMQKQRYADQLRSQVASTLQRIAAQRQAQQDRNTTFQQQLKLQKERAYGMAKKQGYETMMNAPMNAAIMAKYLG